MNENKEATLTNKNTEDSKRLNLLCIEILTSCKEQIDAVGTTMAILINKSAGTEAKQQEMFLSADKTLSELADFIHAKHYNKADLIMASVCICQTTIKGLMQEIQARSQSEELSTKQ